MSEAARGTRLTPWVFIFGGLGLIPFWAPPILTLIDPPKTGGAATLQAIYAGLILSFLGGARFGRAVDKPGHALVISLSMIPSVMSLLILALPSGFAPIRLGFLVIGLALALAWDLHAPDLPRPYKGLRVALTVLAIPPMAAQAILMHPHS